MKAFFLIAITLSAVSAFAQKTLLPASTGPASTFDCLSGPLFVVDARIFPCDSINYIDPDDIMEIQILKGNSAKELYGEAGSKNGTVLITTKNYSLHQNEKRKQEDETKP